MTASISSTKEATISPRPVNKNIPLWIGGSSKAAIRRTARIGTGWQAGAETPAQVAPVIAAIKGRDGGGRPLHRRRPLRNRLLFPLRRLGGRPAALPGQEHPEAHRPRPQIRVRGGIGRRHLRPHRGIYRRRRLQIRPAPDRRQRPGIARPDPAPDRRCHSGVRRAVGRLILVGVIARSRRRRSNPGNALPGPALAWIASAPPRNDARRVG
ncbi:MAG: LLM class flavin-dependent oxidoreductase [Alphaproteobacteria bacterium]|nr:LLM class flavin-dependent oxidoreductase [Alphaproteobacteria bacterium]